MQEGHTSSSKFDMNNDLRPSPLPEITRPQIICGVVEGFYGRPWTLEQRKHLFARLKRLGMNMYLYAPKDDLKHRAEWRILYNDEETEILEDLIKSAKENDVTFVYALSPGIDIVYSHAKDVKNIKDKLDQVRSLGCDSFALLFDDIEPEMNETDKQQFTSFISAQVAVTTEVYKHLDAPQFLFCPTEYCETRAVPCLDESDYLNTLGKKLIKDIHVLWTGPRVISRYITVEHIRNVARVIGRKPLIWDNLHANDYDQKRVFMGAFMGRPVALKEEIAGLLLNPNCKYETNFVPLHTLSDWNASDMDAPNISNSSATLEAGSVSPVACLAVDTARPLHLYHPLHSLKNSVMLWIEEFNSGSGPTIPPVLRVDINGEVTESILDKPRPSDIAYTAQDSTIQLEEIIQAVVLPECKNPFSSPLSDTIQPINSLTADYGEPMDLVAINRDDLTMELVDDTEDNLDVVMAEIGTTDYEQVCTLVDMFFLPFECGRRAAELLEEFSWLHENAMIMNNTTISKEKLELTQEEWCRRFDSLSDIIKNVNNIFKFIADCPNKPLVSELIPYAWEAHASCAVLLGVARWMKKGLVTVQPEERPMFWNNVRDDEPWVLGGGFLIECWKLLASGGAIVQLFMNKALLPLSIVNYELRPFVEADLDALSLLAMTNVTKDIELLQLRKDLFLDKYIMPFIRSQARHCFVAEEMMDSGERKVMCCAAAHQNGRDLYRTLHNHVSSVKEKYSDRLLHGVQVVSHLCEVDKWYPVIPDDIFDHFPAWMDARFVVEPYDAVPTKKLVQTIAATLAINGCTGVFVSFPLCEQDHIQFFAHIGFSELGRSIDGRFFLLGHLLTSKSSTSDDVNIDA